MADQEKLVIMATHGPTDPELATIPFVMALRRPRVRCRRRHRLPGRRRLSRRTRAWPRQSSAQEFPPLAKLIADFQELGGTLLVCSPCVKSRGIADALIPGAEIVAAARFVAEITWPPMPSSLNQRRPQPP